MLSPGSEVSGSDAQREGLGGEWQTIEGGASEACRAASRPCRPERSEDPREPRRRSTVSQEQLRTLATA
eukprot:15467999-Alexandrium_andersonii.AAC.1